MGSDANSDSPSGAPVHNSYGLVPGQKDAKSPNQSGSDSGSDTNSESPSGAPVHNSYGVSQTGSAGEKPKEEKSLKELAQEPKNRTMLGDPVSLKAEKSDNEPTDQDRGALPGEHGKNKRESKI